jgi:hypothetical protein
MLLFIWIFIVIFMCERLYSRSVFYYRIFERKEFTVLMFILKYRQFCLSINVIN